MMKNHLLLISLIILTGLFIYGATIQHPYHWDDYRTIVDNPALTDPFRLQTVFSFWPTRAFLFWTFSLNYAAGSHPLLAYHLTNIVIHLSAAIVLYLLIYRTLAIGTTGPVGTAGTAGTVNYTWVAAIAALLFVAHPVATGAVTYLIQRGVSLSAALGLLSILIYTYARGNFFREGRGFLSLRHILLYGLSLILLSLAMLTKEGALVFPILIVGWELIFGGKKHPGRSRFLYLLPFILMIAIIPIISLTTAKSANLQDDILYQINRPWNPVTVTFLDGGEGLYLANSWEYFLTQLKSIAIYIRLSFLPVRQNFYYHLPPRHSLFEGKSIFLLMGYISLLMVGIKLVLRSKFLVHMVHKVSAVKPPRSGVRGLGAQVPTTPLFHQSNTPAPISRKLIGAGILWFFIALIPTSSFLILWPFLSEFHLYLSLAGLSFFWAGLLILSRRSGPRRLCRVLFLLAVFTFALLAIRRNTVYSSAVVLWEDTVEKSPRLAAAHSNLAAAYIGRGNFTRAIKESRLAMDLNPKFNGYRNLRTAYRAQGEPAKATELIDEEIERFPESYRGYYEKALTIINDDPAAAHQFFLKALEKNPPLEIRSRIEKEVRLKEVPKVR